MERRRVFGSDRDGDRRNRPLYGEGTFWWYVKAMAEAKHRKALACIVWWWRTREEQESSVIAS